MLSAIPVTNIPTALTTTPAAVASPASDIVSTRLTSIALPAPLAENALKNDAQKNRPIIVTANAAETVSQTSVTTVNNNTRNAGGSSTQFLAQLLSQTQQSEDSQIGLATTFARFAPAPTYNTLIGYSVVKFRPSNAGLPSAYSPSTPVYSNLSENNSATPASHDYKAYSAAQARNSYGNADNSAQLELNG